MKELSIEEKAKRYDEVIAMAKECITYIPDEVVNKYMLSIFPELKETEDERGERIRKEIIKYIESRKITPNHPIADEWIAWLEKQGEQKPVDKIEPKFKVGDWVVTSYGKVNQVISVNKDGDGYTLDDDTYFSGSWCDSYHLWTIEDAKDGDVLVYGDNPNDHHVEVIMIFKSLRNKHSAFTHFHIFDNNFRTDDWCDCGKNIHPATKEQRDLLFQKMKEAGYEWDEDKKELIKL